MTPATLEQLKSSALEVATDNGHKMSVWRKLPDWPSARVSFCCHCHASIAIDAKPLNGSTGFRGSALDNPCTQGVTKQ